MELIDSHCHLDLSAFDGDRSAVLAAARAAGVGGIVIPGVSAAGWSALLALCRGDGELYPALGLHPLFIDSHAPGDLQRLRETVARERPVAIGEIGLDYHARDMAREAQRALFEAQLAIAAEFALPVLLHVRKAHDEVLAYLRRIPVRGGIAHAFNGSLQQAQGYIDLGFKLGFGGMLTYERSSKLRRLATELPLQAIVLETDAPDMSPAAHRGERNSPAYLPEVLEALVRLRPESSAVIAEVTSENVREVLGLVKSPT